MTNPMGLKDSNVEVMTKGEKIFSAYERNAARTN